MNSNDNNQDSKASVSSVLAMATCALLGTAVSVPVAASEDKAWNFDTALLYYGESENRVRDISAAIAARRDFGDQRIASASLTADSLTGASASGAIALDRPQTFTRPSAKGVYTTPAGQVPLDNTFHDTRFAGTAGWSQPLGRLYTGSAGIAFSNEHDYMHIGANLGVSRDFNKRNTTLSFGLAYSQDEINPEGGIPKPLDYMREVGYEGNKIGKDTKNVIDVLIGVTQVLNRNTLLRVNYSYSKASGYLTDPYKILSVVDPISGDTLTQVAVTPGPDGIYRFESRPDSRAKQSIFAELKHSFGKPVLYTSYRYMTDDWEIKSHTLEGKLRWPIGESNYIEPLLRYYTQTNAKFYRSSLKSGENPLYASADFRLGDFDAVTAGVKFGHRLASGNEWNIRVEYYKQSGQVPSDQIIGNQARRIQFPELKAVIAQVSYSFGL